MYRKIRKINSASSSQATSFKLGEYNPEITQYFNVFSDSQIV